jgi:acyl-CoA dehydrogenase
MRYLPRETKRKSQLISFHANARHTVSTVGIQFAADEREAELPVGNDLKTRIDAAVEVARKFAGSVDSDARFPKEAFDALRAQRLLGIMLPRKFGGEDASLRDAAQVCYALGRVCSSTAMIYAMHQANIACISDHADDNPRFAAYLRRVGEAQLLIASSTTEGRNGANLRSSDSAIVRDGAAVSLSRNASVVSYGADADAILTTARRSPESVPSDQVLALFFKASDYELQQTNNWDVMGMRGTCSEGFQLEARGEAEQVLGTPYEKIHRRSMLPVTHLLWATCWSGVAAGAVERAQGFVRKAARNAKGVLPPGASQATEASLSLMTLVNMVDAALSDHEQRQKTEAGLDDIVFQAQLNLLKVSASELAITTVMHALNAAGIAGYRNDSEFSISRPLRDVLSSAVMINNNRIRTSVGPSCLIGGVPESIGRSQG